MMELIEEVKMATKGGKVYQPRTFKLSGLSGISDETLEMHFKLYEGYVAGTNLMNEQISSMIQKKEVGTPAYAEMTRRLGFEYNGMVLHEYYS
jgi:Fe-Mn family superoxide dismutase